MKHERIKTVASVGGQGAEFRPFIHRLAADLGLKGWVMNSPQGALFEMEGERARLDAFLLRLDIDKPSVTTFQSVESSFLDPVGYAQLEVLSGPDEQGEPPRVLPDIAACVACLRETFDPDDRRYMYPFTSCSNCGPRLSIMESPSFKRANTAMKAFAMCSKCEREYRDPTSRRYRSELNACPDCGPQLELWAAGGKMGKKSLRGNFDCLLGATQAIRAGKIVALKSIGGFQLIADARNEEVVRRIRKLKNREEKPYSVMFPSLEAIRAECLLDASEERLVSSPQGPIVLLERRKATNHLAPAVALRSSYLGAMLPHSALHHLIARALDFPVVTTSPHSHDAPVCIDDKEALERLRDMADVFLIHDCPIVRRAEDSVARVLFGRNQILRRGRGHASLRMRLNETLPSVLALGGDSRNTMALSLDHEIFIGQPIDASRKAAAELTGKLEFIPEIVACDLRSESPSTQTAQEFGVPIVPIQHHHAHVAACVADNELTYPVLGVCWDGRVDGPDGSAWGSEFLSVDESSCHRFAHFRMFHVVDGGATTPPPRNVAISLLYEIFGDCIFDQDDLAPIADFSRDELEQLRKTMEQSGDSPLHCGAERLFDAVASLLGLRQRNSFPGQSAMELEFVMQRGVERAYPFDLNAGSPGVVDWQPMFLEILENLRHGEPIGVIAAKFFNTLAEIIVSVARLAGIQQVVLTGDCFHNKYLTERSVRRLREEAFRPYWHQRVPPNDGGLALGQLMVACRTQSIDTKSRSVVSTARAAIG